MHTSMVLASSTWRANPVGAVMLQILDSHLWVPGSPGFYVFYGNRGSCSVSPFACLDIDDTNGYGPETVTISQFTAGKYTYAVQRYSMSGELAGSGARVQVYDNSGLILDLTIPTSGSGTWWHVFDFDGLAGTLTLVNQILGASPGP